MSPRKITPEERSAIMPLGFTREKDHAWVPEAPPSLDGITDIELNCETTGLRWWSGDKPVGLGLRTPDGRTWYLPCGHRGGGNLDEAVLREWCRRELRGKRITNINTRFDIHILREWGVDLEAQGCEVSDVAHYAALLDDHRQRFALDILAQDFLGGSEIPRVDESHMADYHAGEVQARARHQVELVHRLKEIMWPQLSAEGLQKVRQLEDDVIYVVCEMEKNGSPLDEELLDRWVKESEQEFQRALWGIYRETGLNINPDAPKDQERLFKHLSIPIVETSSGRASFTDAIVKQVQHPVVQLMRRAGKLSDLRSKYLVKYQKCADRGVLRYALHQLRMQKEQETGGGGAGTVSGRFSSTELVRGVGLNIQQIMKTAKQIKAYGDKYLVRQLHIPEPGMQWLSADAKQIEYRIFASYTGNPAVVEAYRENPDLSFHKFIWEMIKPFKPDITYRQQKDLNFAKIYGAGQIKMAEMMEFITPAQAEELRREKRYSDPLLAEVAKVNRIYNEQLPEVPILLERAKRLAETRGHVATVLGRRTRFINGARSHKALNGVIQGGAADVNKRKLVELHKARAYTGFKMRFTVHDEVDGDIPDGEHAKRVAEVLDTQSFPEFKVPILWDVSSGGNWYECSEEFQEGQKK